MVRELHSHVESKRNKRINIYIYILVDGTVRLVTGDRVMGAMEKLGFSR